MNTLKKIVVDLKQLGEIFRELQRADALATQSGVDELRAREKITNYLFLVKKVQILSSKFLKELDLIVICEQTMIFSSIIQYCHICL